MTPPTPVMPSCFDLTADPDYHIQELLAEAEHDRLVSRCTAETVSSHAGGLRLRRLVLLSVAAGVLYVGAARVLAAPTPEPTRPIVRAPVTTAPDRAGAAGCWVSGDLVGGGNPAQVAAALCGPEQPPAGRAQP